MQSFLIDAIVLSCWTQFVKVQQNASDVFNCDYNCLHDLLFDAPLYQNCWKPNVSHIRCNSQTLSLLMWRCCHVWIIILWCALIQKDSSYCTSNEKTMLLPYYLRVGTISEYENFYYFDNVEYWKWQKPNCIVCTHRKIIPSTKGFRLVFEKNEQELSEKKNVQRFVFFCFFISNGTCHSLCHLKLVDNNLKKRMFQCLLRLERLENTKPDCNLIGTRVSLQQ